MALKLTRSLLACFLAGTFMGSPQAKTKLDFSTIYAQNMIVGMAATEYLEAVKKESNGEIDIAGHFGGALGYNSRSQYTATEEGAVDLAQYPLDNLLGLDPMYELHSLPFIATTMDGQRRLYKAALPYLEKAFNKANQTILFSAPFTFQGIWSKTPVRNAADLKDMKMRTVEVISTTIFGEVGASPIQMAWGETLPAISTNAVTGMVTSDDTGVSSSVWDLGVKYFTPLNQAIGIAVTTMNRDSFESLSKDQQALMRKVAGPVEDAAWERAARQATKNEKTLESHGGQFVHDVDPALVNALKEAGAPFIEKWKSKVGPEASTAVFGS